MYKTSQKIVLHEDDLSFVSFFVSSLSTGLDKALDGGTRILQMEEYREEGGGGRWRWDQSLDGVYVGVYFN